MEQEEPIACEVHINSHHAAALVRTPDNHAWSREWKRFDSEGGSAVDSFESVHWPFHIARDSLPSLTCHCMKRSEDRCSEAYS
jgi:hypothetical protein